MSTAQDKTTGVDPGEGWRLLAQGEKTQAGDELLPSRARKWRIVGSQLLGLEVGDRSPVVRRRIVQPEPSRGEAAERAARAIVMLFHAADHIRAKRDGTIDEETANIAEIIRAELAATDARVRELEAENARLKDALHTDRTGLANAVARIHQTAVSYGWVAQGRGPYEWDDPKYRKEMGRMVAEIVKLAADALRESGDRAHAHCCGRKALAATPNEKGDA